jgi:hypothetical protein
MDAQDINAVGRLHCGNWISYCYRHSWLSRIVMIGCDDFRNSSTFDRKITEDQNLLFFPQFDQVRLCPFLDPSASTYVSIDTDVLNVPSDWGIGRHPIESVLSSTLWSQLKNMLVVGAFLHGHVTDRRGFVDVLKRSLEDGFIKKLSLRTSFLDTWYCFYHKLRASFHRRSVKLHQEAEIISSLYQKIAEIGIKQVNHSE